MRVQTRRPMNRGYYGVAIYNGKNEINYGTLLRTSHLLGASFFCVIGKRFKRQASDTMKSHRHVPTFEYSSFDDFYKNLPFECQLVGVELSKEAKELKDFVHPQRA